MENKKNEVEKEALIVEQEIESGSGEEVEIDESTIILVKDGDIND